MKICSPFSGLMSPFEWCEDALEFGVVDRLDIGDPGFVSLDVGFSVDLPSVFIDESVEWLLDIFCWDSRSCFRNLARRFWNQTWNGRIYYGYCFVFSSIFSWKVVNTRTISNCWLFGESVLNLSGKVRQPLAPLFATSVVSLSFFRSLISWKWTSPLCFETLSSSYWLLRRRWHKINKIYYII